MSCRCKNSNRSFGKWEVRGKQSMSPHRYPSKFELAKMNVHGDGQHSLIVGEHSKCPVIRLVSKTLPTKSPHGIHWDSRRSSWSVSEALLSPAFFHPPVLSVTAGFTRDSKRKKIKTHSEWPCRASRGLAVFQALAVALETSWRRSLSDCQREHERSSKESEEQYQATQLDADRQ
jgi:hypothetical protein